MQSLVIEINQRNRFATDHVMDMTGVWINSELKELKVDSLEELQHLRNDLLTKPILFHIKVTHQTKKECEGIDVSRIWKREFVVLVNTRHPSIREFLSYKLNEVTQKMQEGKRFCLKLDFSPPVKHWFSGMADPNFYWDNSRSSSDSGHMEIFIHNYNTPIECCYDQVLIACCFPIWLLFGGPCYRIHRAIKCTDVIFEFHDCPVVSGEC
ncbi:uncharacterized protein LOC134228542 [Saccostrea cucullata]|uniref:uncharacterized protein LOC134228542 n=1 Tax=Saccostrea cuccullata TaxID=36930 RepID=UPI002ED2FC22